jgi:hypothetical protein
MFIPSILMVLSAMEGNPFAELILNVKYTSKILSCIFLKNPPDKNPKDATRLTH